MLLACVASLVLLGAQPSQYVTPGQLIVRPTGEGEAVQVCPLKGTVVSADIAGLSARVTVVQTFTNPYDHPIEAVYTFPMGANAAVDRMRIMIGKRVIEGEIMRAEEARMVYDAAKAAGQTAALLDQERPNIFTQSIANIMPGSDIQVEISYVEMIDYEDGEFEFVFPMVVGPRNTMNAVDAEKIDPPTARTGSDIRLSVFIDAGAPLENVTSTLHEIDVRRRGPGKFEVSLARNDEIPNRDFILNWSPVGDGLQESFLTHASGGKGTFCLTLFPPKRVEQQYIAAREVVFVIDQSGSQAGYPIEKSKELTQAMIDQLGPNDTFNVVTFTTTADFLWPQPMPNTVERVREAKQFVAGLTTGGGTDFGPPLKATITRPPRDGRIRMIVFNSDGYIGDDFQILDLINRFNHNARLFTFGIGNSVNRFLIDSMSAEGRGASEIVTLESDVDEAIGRFMQRVQNPVLTDIRVQVAGGGVHDLTPNAIPDMFSENPIVVFGRFEQPGPAKVTVSGRLGGVPWQRTIDVVFPSEGDSGEGITTVWARKRLDEMLRQDWLAAVRATIKGETVRETDQKYVEFALRHGIMSQWTSFIAVEKRVVNVGGRQRTVRVPVEQASGVSFGGGGQLGAVSNMVAGAGSVPRGIRSVQYDPTDNSLIVRGANASLAMLSQLSGAAIGQLYRRGSVFAGSKPGTFARASSPIITGRALGGDRSVTTLGAVASDQSVEQLQYQYKLHKTLQVKKEGALEVQVMVTEWPDDWKKLLEEAGLKVEDSDEGLKVVFGTVDATKLLELAKLEFVTEIRPLED